MSASDRAEIRIAKQLLSRADAAAAACKISRSELMRRGLKLALLHIQFHGEAPPKRP